MGWDHRGVLRAFSWAMVIVFSGVIGNDEPTVCTMHGFPSVFLTLNDNLPLFTSRLSLHLVLSYASLFMSWPPRTKPRIFDGAFLTRHLLLLRRDAHPLSSFLASLYSTSTKDGGTMHMRSHIVYLGTTDPIIRTVLETVIRGRLALSLSQPFDTRIKLSASKFHGSCSLFALIT